jgi:biotin-dependent carboxylase-like uncharacterized protein
MPLFVIEPGLSTTVQDLGRPGFRAWGVPVGGAFDAASFELANALVGNPPGHSALEMTLTGGTYQAEGSLALALAGAPMEARVIGPDGSESAIQVPSSFTLATGGKLVLRRALDGARTYLAVAGGWQTVPVLGSRSSEERLRAGDVLVAANGAIASRRLNEPKWQSPESDPFRLIAVADDRATPALGDAFWVPQRFTVTAQSNRMGLRLEGPPIAIAAPPDRLSTPVAPGTLQVAGGQLIVLGVACGTMGGYPVVGHVIAADLDRLGQLRPGNSVAFRTVSVDEARSLDRAMRLARAARLQQLATVLSEG